MELEDFFTIIQQTYSKLVISFMNRVFLRIRNTFFIVISVFFAYPHH
jgi:hypothetical protein